MLKLLKLKPDLVVVGGFAMFLHGLKKEYTDIDVVVRNLDGLGKVFSYSTNSAFSKSGKRAFIPGDTKVDIFIEKTLPTYEIKNGFKVQTIKSMISYYEIILPYVQDFWKEDIYKRLELLK